MDAAVATRTHAEWLDLAARALRQSGASAEAAMSVAHSVVAAEADGQSLVGLAYVPFYCDNAACGKVAGRAVPSVARPRPGLVEVDARDGFAHPAIDAGLPLLIEAARSQGVAALLVRNAYACGSVGYHVERVAAAGLVCLAAANASPSIAPWGGATPFFGTNPVALAAPVAGRAPLVIDQSASVVAKVAVIQAAAKGHVPEGWALDAQGSPTTDPARALAGSMAPAGGYKGVGLALLVDILAAGLTGAHFSYEASSFGDLEGGPPRTGQCLIALAPPDGLGERLVDLLSAMTGQPGARAPGERRLRARADNAATLTIPRALADTLDAYARDGSPHRA